MATDEKKQGIYVDYINGVKTDKIFGFKRYQDELHMRLKHVKLNRIEYVPLVNPIGHLFQLLISYPLKVMRKIKRGRIKHITTPNLAYLQNIFRFKNCLITCYDLIAYHRKKDFGFLQRVLISLNYMGLKRARHIVTIANHAKDDIARTFNMPASKITVIHPCVDYKRYYPKRDRGVLKQYGIKRERVLLYIGSEEPRQNVDKIILALDILVKQGHDIKFVKVGRPQWHGGRERLEKLIKQFGLEGRVVFTDYVEEELLPMYYNAADIVLYPCAYTGWGLPPMEAMACGVPVITSNTTTLPEVVGEGGIMIDPDDYRLLAEKIEILLQDDKLRKKYIEEAFKHLKKFSWDNEAKKFDKVYDMMERWEKNGNKNR